MKNLPLLLPAKSQRQSHPNLCLPFQRLSQTIAAKETPTDLLRTPNAIKADQCRKSSASNNKRYGATTEMTAPIIAIKTGLRPTTPRPIAASNNRSNAPKVKPNVQKIKAKALKDKPNVHKTKVKVNARKDKAATATVGKIAATVANESGKTVVGIVHNHHAQASLVCWIRKP